ncbi:MAG: SCP2 sterol-binding domain-containing protein [Oceanospirillaceae bacterium]|nr:SCP2 sterol-binding domain-containing protein [Oceanospirillaceae bacterium]
MEMVTAALLETAEASLNLLLQTRPLLRERLLKLNGKSIRINIEPRGLSLLLSFHTDGIALSQDAKATADAEISGDLATLVRLATEPRSVLFGQGAKISGDAALVQRLQKSMRDAELDWETWLADQIGDTATAALKQIAAPLRDQLQQSHQSLSLNAREYLQEELAAVPARVEFEIWSEGVSRARTKLEQLERRIERLSQ